MIGMPLVLGAREGARFQDAYSGRWYWNCHCNGGVFNLGHRHPAVVGAVRTALDGVDIGNHHLMSPWRGALAERLVVYKLPRTIEFVTEPLRDEAGKVRRSALRQARLPAS